ncbi:hypothetical protein J7384_13650 [Endozoicomonas sp. G2_1]|uniref:hypothetical protein n=1 Tax=Endozoicomonas sp. G2_1 TaxID=2821091 RepID=UPI001ADD167B|nr:hypothetical protein [Endozoicomonas sp. G2_1]MBO9491406.1 hypothetical protein [Endozoicomonas sp. G2_1]
MFKYTLAFICGLIISAITSFMYYNELLRSAAEVNSLVVNNQLNYYKNIYSDKALKIINSNNNYVQRVMSRKFDDSERITAQVMLASALLLTDMTVQSVATKENTFLVMMMFYARTSTASEFEQQLKLMTSFCKTHTVIKDCSQKGLIKMFDQFKNVKYQ